MVNPTKVLNFLDITGNWDPSLILVMLAAVAITSLSSYFTLKRARPLLSELFHLPTKKELDWKLILGSSLFGIGWGLIGVCPGPALAALVYGYPLLYLFVGSMLLGMILKRILKIQ